MESKFLVYSADWEVEVAAKSFTDAALLGTETMFKRLGELFNISRTVVVVKNKTHSMKFYSPIAIFEDLHMYRLADQLHRFLKIS